MTDGTTGTVGPSSTIAPVASEDDMSKLAELFSRAANAVVQASSLPKQVNELQTQLDAMQRDRNLSNDHIIAQDNTINELRSMRDTALSHATDLGSQLGIAQSQIEGLTSRSASAELTIAQLNDELETTRKARDEYGLRAMQLEDDLKAVRDRLASTHAKTKALLEGLGMEEAKPAEAVLDIPKQAYHPEPGERSSWVPEMPTDPIPAPVEPLPPEAMPDPPLDPAPAKPDFVDEWEPGYGWNGQRYARLP